MKIAYILISYLFISFSLHSFALVGHDVQKADLKYQAVGQINADCTATLIKSKILITAAHCVYQKEPSDLKINFMGLSETVPVLRVITPNYIRFFSPMGRGQDIAILEIPEMTKIKPIELMLSSENIRTESKITLAGYGRFQIQNENCYGDTSKQLLIGDSMIETIENLFPEEQWGGTLILSGQSTAVCSGDSGGPAIMQINQQLYVIGIIGDGGYNRTSVLSFIPDAKEFITDSIEKIELGKGNTPEQKLNVLEGDWVSSDLSELNLTWKNDSSKDDICELTIGMSKNQPFEFNEPIFETIYLKKTTSCADSLRFDQAQIKDALKFNHLEVTYEKYPIGTKPQHAKYENITTLSIILKNKTQAGYKMMISNCSFYLDTEKNIKPVRQDYGHHCSTGFIKN